MRLTGAYYGYRTTCVPWNREAYEQETVRAIIDCIATHAAKGTAYHVVLDGQERIREVKHNSPYAKLLNQQPNPLMTGFDFKYKLVAQLETKTTAICYVKWDGVKPRALWPISYNDFQIYEVKGGGYAIELTDYDGARSLLPLEDVVILRKFYCEREVGGDGIAPIQNSLDMVKASDDGFIEALAVSNKVRGLYRSKKSMLDPKDVEAGQEDFARRFEAAAQSGGVVGVDALEDYVPLNVTAYAADADQMKAVRDNLFTFWRTPEAIVKSDYTEQQGQAWTESVIEPDWEKLGQAFSNAFFTQAERDRGNRIIFTGGNLLGASMQTRVNVINATRELALLTINEQRQLLGYPPVEGGDKRLVSLNYVDADKQNLYQLGEGTESGQNEAD